MKPVRRLVGRAAHSVGSALVTAALWVLWTGLAALALLQIYGATRHELTLPGYVAQRLQSRLAEDGFRVTFERATFDPTGRILAHEPRVFSVDFQEPLVTARAAYVDLNLWALLVGRIDAREVRLVDGSVQVPAMLSPSGRAEPILRNVDAYVVPGSRQVAIRHITGKLGRMAVTVQGEVSLRRPREDRPRLPVVLSRRLGDLGKAAFRLEQQLDKFEDPQLSLRLEPAATVGARVSAVLSARSVKLEAPIAAVARMLTASLTIPLIGEMAGPAEVRASVGSLELPRGIRAQQIDLLARGRWQRNEGTLAPDEISAVAGRVQTPDGDIDAVSIAARPAPVSTWIGAAVGRALGSELLVRGEFDPAAKTARAELSGAVSPAIMLAINRRARVDVRRHFDFDELRCDRLTAQFGPGWRFERLTGQVWLKGIHAHGILMEEGDAWVELEPRRFHSPRAYARIGENFARGSYEHDFSTHAFRFLLDGRLRPLAISGWFHDWWPRFFERFDFPAEPPLASVDVRGVWRHGRRTSVFVFADVAKPVLLGQPLARVRTRLFIRPGHYDTLEMAGTDGRGGAASGVFTVTTNPDTGRIRAVDVEGNSTLGFDLVTGLGGAPGRPFLSPFTVQNAPALSFRGHFEGPEAGARQHQRLDLSAHTSGGFTFHGLPFEDVVFTTTLRDDVLTIDSAQGRFAGGTAKLHAKVWGPSAERRMGFDASVSDVSLGVVVGAMQRFMAARKGLPAPAPGKFVQEKANVRMDVAASADGLYGDPLSFRGGGTVDLRGAEIGEVSLFGPLSQLLTFTQLRFNKANATFKIAGSKVLFPEVALRGNNSAIDGHGEYALDRRQLDFRVKVFPFQESGNVIKSVVGAVLTPLSNALEVKLTGTLEEPEWAFVMGPTNLLRSLAPEAEPEKPAAPAGTPAHLQPDQPAAGSGNAASEPPKPTGEIAPTPP